MLIPKIFILAERLKPLVNVILTLCSCLLVRKHRITARLQGSVLDFWQTPAKPCFIRWYVAWNEWEENMFLKIQEAVTLLNQEYLQAVRIKNDVPVLKGIKRLYISKSFLEKRQESYENILSEKGILYRMNRSNGFTFFRFLISSLISTRLERFSSLLQVVHVSVNLQAHWIKCRPL